MACSRPGGAGHAGAPISACAPCTLFASLKAMRALPMPLRQLHVCCAPSVPVVPRGCLCALRRQRLLRGLRLRLAMLEPYVASWPQALSLLAAPSAAPRTLQLYAELADTLWHAAGDTSADLSW